MKKTNWLQIVLVVMLACSMTLVGCRKEKEIEKEIETSKEIDTEVLKEDITLSESNEETNNQANEVETMPVMHLGSLDVKVEEIFNEDFEDNESGFIGRGDAITEIVTGKGYSSDNALYTSGRTNSWNGPVIDITDKVEVNGNYNVSAYIMYEEGPDTMEMDCMLEKNGNTYLNFGSSIVKKGEWTEIKGHIVMPDDIQTINLYFESHYGTESSNFITFYIDNIVVTKETIQKERGELPSLSEIYKDYFTIGFASTVSEAAPSLHELLNQQFNSLTIGNELKPDSLLDYETCISDPKYNDNPAISFKNAAYLLEFAKESGIPVRGHTLVWHAQTPRWFFAEGYSTLEDAPLVSKELMLKRMENYIKNVLELAEVEYPGLIYAWDVVNEAIEVGDGQEDWIRSKENNWYETIGGEYVEKAFEYARKYAKPNVKLFYNDYNTDIPSKVTAIYRLLEKLKAKNVIDGVGLQSHIGMDSPVITDIENSIRKYAELDLEIQITELDVWLTDNSEKSLMEQASRYKRFMSTIKYLKKSEAANITNVTFWGITDATTWLSKPGEPNYPLLFDKYEIQKPAFWGVALSPDVPLY